MSFASLLNLTLTVRGFTPSGEDGGGQPTGSWADKGTVRGRIDHRVKPDERDGPDANPVIADYLGITALPSGFTITERDRIVVGSATYEVLGVAELAAYTAAHHLELTLTSISA